MKQILYKNIDLLRIPIKAGISEYYFPQNVDWADCVVDKIVPLTPENACNDPMDGYTPVITRGDITDVYFNIYSAGQKEILHAVSIEQISHLNNNPIWINSKLDLSLCNLYFTTPPAADGILLIYVYHETECKDTELPERSVTVTFPLEPGEVINFRQIISTYIHALPATVKGMLVWSAVDAPAYITLRDHELTYILQNLHSELARPNMNDGTDTQVNPMLFDRIDIDFEYSHIRNAENNANVQKITFLY